MRSNASCRLTDRAPSVAFDQIAESYDDLFTRSVIGRAQRSAVWEVLGETFRTGECVLELNCGTGEDALFLARQGVSVFAFDASAGMIEVAEKRKVTEGPELPVDFRIAETERIGSLAAKVSQFDGVVSNFSGLNCVRDLRAVGADLARMTAPNARLVLCLSSRFCLWEMLWFSAHLNFKKAFRRISGSASGHIGDLEVNVWYPTVSQVQNAFAPWFRLRLVRAVGFCVPPSYLEYWAAKHRGIITSLVLLDRGVSRLPFLSGLGDHILLRFEKVSS